MELEVQKKIPERSKLGDEAERFSYQFFWRFEHETFLTLKKVLFTIGYHAIRPLELLEGPA